MSAVRTGTRPCRCQEDWHETRLIAVTGPPGAGKTGVLEIARRSFCPHVAILPDAASIVFGGGFPEHDTVSGHRAAQRAIYHVQRQLERLVEVEGRVGVALCERGTIDGLAYWPDSEAAFWEDVGSTHSREMARYSLVVHLRRPSTGTGSGELGVREAREEAEFARIDERMAEVWHEHPHYEAIEGEGDFVARAGRALEILREHVPPCCREHALDAARLG